VFLTLLAALLVLALAQAAPALAAGPFTGGASEGDYPLYVANDHSVYALRFSASGLEASSDYYVKVRISPTDSISGGTSRGFTWNPTTQEWVQERDEWSKLPSFTTDASGAYSSGNVWTFFKFGDTTKPAEGGSSTWYVFVSVQPLAGGEGTTLNSATSRAVTLIDMTGRLGWARSALRVHNGTAVGVTKSQRVNALAAGLADVYSVMRTEPNDVVEGYGGTAAGDFSIAVPAGLAFDTGVNSSAPAWAITGFTGAVAGVDIALGAADTTPPGEVDSFSSSREPTVAHLSWDAVADAESYTVYQWQDPTPIDGVINYTSQPLPVAATATTSYSVTGLTEGQDYHFAVRAVDAATNAGPLSRYPVELTLATSATVVGWGKAATLSGTLGDGADEPFAEGSVVTVQSSVNGGATWADVGEYDLEALAGYAVTPKQKTRYRLVFAGDSVHRGGESPVVTVTPKVALGKPQAPSAVKRGAKFTAYGSIAPRQAVGAKAVRIKCYVRQGGAWRYVKSVSAVNKTTTRYSARFSLPSRGPWKLVASYKATAKYAATTSSAEYLRIK
jgi:hypothetical protein